MLVSWLAKRKFSAKAHTAFRGHRSYPMIIKSRHVSFSTVNDRSRKKFSCFLRFSWEMGTTLLSLSVYIYISQNNLTFPSQFETSLCLCFAQIINKIQQPWNLHYLYDGEYYTNLNCLEKVLKEHGKKNMEKFLLCHSSKITYTVLLVAGLYVVILFK